MNQINPNLKTLGQMISMNDFCDWFFNSNSNLLTGENPINIFVQQNIALNSIPVYYFNCPALVQYWSNLNQFNQLNNNWTYLFTNLLGSIYQLFENVIPYDQSTTTYTIQPVYQGSSDVQYVTTEIPNVLKQISSYFGMYQNRLLQYMVVMCKYLAQINVMNGGYTNTYAYNTKSGSASQANNYNINSFNPVATLTSLDINPITVNNGSYNNNIDNPFSIQSGSPSVTVTGANYNNYSGASASNSNQFATNNATNLENFATVGSGDGLTILRPFIEKVSSLFWSLSNDYYGNNDGWGFNIW